MNRIDDKGIIHPDQRLSDNNYFSSMVQAMGYDAKVALKDAGQTVEERQAHLDKLAALTIQGHLDLH